MTHSCSYGSHYDFVFELAPHFSTATSRERRCEIRVSEAQEKLKYSVEDMKKGQIEVNTLDQKKKKSLRSKLRSDSGSKVKVTPFLSNFTAASASSPFSLSKTSEEDEPYPLSFTP
ncbi:hypothetical protein MTR_6g047600 [Medicago truncatula]|uniref:Uncharacterized protein n=1 Tax=Medicago truncatula TaxID=3880 RepID=A0A072U8U0_MEDTR|nr:hypothetical protein MTR_6g047600 [Medicago truncatula]